MKKILTLTMTLCIAAGAFSAVANPFAAQAKKTSSRESQVMNYQVMPVIEGDFDLKAMQDACPIKVHATDPTMKHAQKVNASRKAVMADTTKYVLAKEGYAMFLGTYFYYYYGSYTNAWELCFTTTNDVDIVLDFESNSSTRIAGYYRDASVMIFSGKDTIQANGILEITYKGKGTSSSPTYTYSGEFTDDKDNVYAISGEYAFPANTANEPWVFDYMYYMFCYYYSYYCDDMAISLTDSKEPEIQDTVSVAISGNAYRVFDEKSGTWSLSIEDSKTLFNTKYYNDGNFDDMTGTFDSKSLYVGSTILYSISKSKYTAVDIFKPMDLKVETKNDTTFFTEALLGLDGHVYMVSFCYAEPVAKKTVQIIALGNYSDYIKDERIMLGSGLSFDSAYVASFAVYTDALTGKFTTKNCYGGGSYNYIAQLGKDTIYYDMVKDTIEITAAVPDSIKQFADYVVSMKMVAVNSDDPTDVKEFVVTLFVANYFKFDATTDVTATFTEGTDYIEIVTEYYEEYGMILIYATNMVDNEFEAYVLPEELDDNYTLPLGDYPIDNSEDYPSMYASAGYSYMEGPQPAYFAKGDGLWLITGGTFVVEPLVWTVKGKNSNGKNVTITLNVPSTGIEQLAAEKKIQTMKVMRNGQLVIINNGKLYNALGAEIVK